MKFLISFLFSGVILLVCFDIFRQEQGRNETLEYKSCMPIYYSDTLTYRVNTDINMFKNGITIKREIRYDLLELCDCYELYKVECYNDSTWIENEEIWASQGSGLAKHWMPTYVSY